MASTEFSPYDSADYLASLDDAAPLPRGALEEAGDDPAIAQVLGTIARSRNMSELA